jgi:PAS domain S-box-containing protein
MSTLLDWLLPASFLPHGHCYLWRPDVLWLHVGSDAVIAGSYYAIPIALAYFVRRRHAVLPYWWLTALFATFIFLCGSTHAMSIWTVWHPDYVVDGLIKLATALASAATAIAVFVALPSGLALRSPIELQGEVDARTAQLLAANARLREEIEARERTEAALRESESRFRATFENAAVGIAHVAPDGRWLHVNAVFSEITGYSREELLAHKFADITHPADLEKDWSQARRLLAGAIDSYALDKRYIRKDGSIVWVMLTVSLMRARGGEPLYFISVIDDITERKRTVAALQESELRTRLALEASGAATWVIDYAHGGAEHFDDRSCELAGLDAARKEWPAGTFCRLLHPDDRERMQVAARATQAIAGPGPLINYRIVRGDGTVIWLEGSGIVQRDTDGSARQFVGVSIDISEGKRLERALRDTIEKLAEADRRKDEFLATLAHELRNPLAPIGNGVQIVKLCAGTDEKLRRTAEMMERQMSHLVRLVDDLLDLSRITRGKVVLREGREELKQVLAGALEATWGPMESKHLELIVSMCEEPISVEGDRDRLTQVFSNILSNAAKYTDAGGKVWLSLHREGEEAVISVRDSGIGIAAESLESVFEMFSQLRPSGQGEMGLGLGLALVRQLVQLHGGRVEARSQGPGHGSEFVVRLPALAPAPRATGLPAQGPIAPAAGPRRVLVVEDNCDAAESLRSLLELLGHEVRQVPDGAGAIEAVSAFKPDIVFMDIGLPGMNGLETTLRIRELPITRQPFIVALTGWGQEADRERSGLAGINHHLVKPIDYETLRGVLEQASRA